MILIEVKGSSPQVIELEDSTPTLEVLAIAIGLCIGTDDEKNLGE